MEMAKLSPPIIETLRSIAKQMVMYLRWIEHLRAEGQEIHELYFPEEEEKRVTWAYYRYLKRLLRQPNDRPISLSVAKSRMQAVIGLYRGLLAWKLVSDSAIENCAYKSNLIGLPVVSSNFASYLRRRISLNLIIDTFLVDIVAPDGQWLDKGAQVTDITLTCKKGDAGE